MTHPQDTTPANPAQGGSEAIDRAVVEAINALRLEHTGRAYDILHETLTAAIGAGGQAITQLEALPRPDAVSMASGTICLEYVDRDERDLAFDWLEAHGAGVALAASRMPVGDGQKYRLLEAGEIIASDDEFIGDDGITWERVKGWPVGSAYTHIFKSCRRPLAAARAREDGK